MATNRYLGKFDENGKPEGFLLEGVHYHNAEEKAAKIAEGYNVDLTQEEWEYYTGNRGEGDNGTGYIYDRETGKPVSAPPRVYTKSELADMAYAHCQSDCTEVDNQIIMAQANGDTELVAELQEEKQGYLTKYQDVLDKIEAGQITNPEELEAEYQDEE
jgi:hypothetical protein